MINGCRILLNLRIGEGCHLVGAESLFHIVRFFCLHLFWVRVVSKGHDMECFHRADVIRLVECRGCIFALWVETLLHIIQLKLGGDLEIFH